jgi:F-type H+-transporting ATPase subunit delta
MLKAQKIARSYANALFTLSIEMGKVEDVRHDMELVQSVLGQNPELCRVLASPIIKSAKKRDILTAVLKKHVQILTLRFVHLLVKALRIGFLKEIATQYIILYLDWKGIRTVTVRSVVPLADDTRETLLTKLRAELNAEIRLEEIIDPRLIGGFVVQAGNTRWDASIRSKLNKLDRQFDINIYKKGF